MEQSDEQQNSVTRHFSCIEYISPAPLSILNGVALHFLRLLVMASAFLPLVFHTPVSTPPGVLWRRKGGWVKGEERFGIFSRASVLVAISGGSRELGSVMLG
jgi:hypothetical protein